jgi:hypothetical protein
VSRDRPCEMIADVSLSSFQVALVRAEVPRIRQGRQQDYLRFVQDVLRGLRIVGDKDVRTAIRHSAERYGRPSE